MCFGMMCVKIFSKSHMNVAFATLQCPGYWKVDNFIENPSYLIREFFNKKIVCKNYVIAFLNVQFYRIDS